MQSVDLDILDLSQASQLLQLCLNRTKDLKKTFLEIISEAKLICQRMGFVENCGYFSNKRIRKVRKNLDELSVDHRFSNAEDIFRVTIFFRIVDIVVQQLESRFAGLSEVSKHFPFLQPQILSHLSDTQNIANANCLQEKYHNDISAAFARQLVLFKKHLNLITAKDCSKFKKARENF